MKRIFLLLGCALCLLTVSGCGERQEQAPVSTAAAATASPDPIIASIEVYNRTGKIQREDFYRYSEGKAAVSYSIEYSYTDSGRLSSVRKNGGAIGENKAIESYLYNGDNCTQRIVYDENGGTSAVWYWTYRKNRLISERLVRMILAENGNTYSGREEIITEYDEDGTAKSRSRSAADDYETDEYTYDEAGNLILDRYSHSSDGKTFRLFETTAYTYDAENRLIKRMVTDALEAVISTEILEYNDKGDIISDTTYQSGEIKDDNISLRKVYEYADNGMLNSLTEYAGEETTQTFYEYNSAGKITATTVQRASEGRPPEKTVTSVEYDTRQNPVRETVRSSDGSTTVSYFCSYDYYDDGKIRNKINYVAE